MNKVILKILVVISIIIIVLGILSAKSLRDEFRNEGMPTQNISADGSAITAFTEAFVELGSGLYGLVIIIYSMLAVACIWGVYGIILLIIMIAKKCESKTNINKTDSPR